ncbi:hypothetical protein [Agathobaculum sp. Marseille-P7918]|uniref:hypothetical protein n=1 Tax=Agathobaculum sp. Marseille-P7918 TaxID=2479843 RepID=UPI003568D7F0
MRRKSRLSHIICPSVLHLQLLFGLDNVLPGLLEPLLHVRNFPLNLPAAFRLIHPQEEMVPFLKGFQFGREYDNLVPDLAALQLVPADFIVHDCHIEEARKGSEYKR